MKITVKAVSASKPRNRIVKTRKNIKRKTKSKSKSSPALHLQLYSKPQTNLEKEEMDVDEILDNAKVGLSNISISEEQLRSPQSRPQTSLPDCSDIYKETMKRIGRFPVSTVNEQATDDMKATDDMEVEPNDKN